MKMFILAFIILMTGCGKQIDRIIGNGLVDDIHDELFSSFPEVELATKVACCQIVDQFNNRYFPDSMPQSHVNFCAEIHRKQGEVNGKYYEYKITECWRPSYLGYEYYEKP